MIGADSDRDNFTDLHCLWDPIDSRPFYRVTMALNWFKFLLHCMRFDNYRDGPARQRSDRLAAIPEVWETFNSNSRNIYIPNEALTVDEKLVGYRGKVPGRTYCTCHQNQGNTFLSIFGCAKPQQVSLWKAWFILEGNLTRDLIETSPMILWWNCA